MGRFLYTCVHNVPGQLAGDLPITKKHRIVEMAEYLPYMIIQAAG